MSADGRVWAAHKYSSAKVLEQAEDDQSRVLTLGEVRAIEVPTSLCPVHRMTREEGRDGYYAYHDGDDRNVAMSFCEGEHDEWCAKRVIDLLIAAPNLHITAEYLYARNAELTADLHRVTMERDGARKALDAAHEARIKQSLELADARAQIVRLHAEAGVVDGLRMALDDARGAAAAWELVARDNADRADRLQERVAELESGR